MDKALKNRISTLRLRLVRDVPFLGSLLLHMKLVKAEPHHDISTMAVTPDGVCYVNEDFAGKLTDGELMFVLCHEVLHLAFLCWDRQGTRTAVITSQSPSGKQGKISLWNIAHDLSFNGIIEEFAQNDDNDLETPASVLIDRKLHGKSAEEIYDILIGRINNSKSGDAAKLCLRGLGNGNAGDYADLRGDLAESDDGKRAAAGDKTAQEKLANEWKGNVLAAALSHEMQKGQDSLPAGVKKLISSITDARVDWREALARWIGENGRLQDYTYRRPARRSHAVGVYMPSSVTYGYDKVCVLWDTSGSMNGREGEILGDIAALCEDLGLSLRIIIIDSEIHADVDNVTDALDIIENIKGGGGSNFCPAFDRLANENYQGVVVAFTDGYIGVPSTKPPSIRGVLWVLTDSDVDPTDGRWGTVLHAETN